MRTFAASMRMHTLGTLSSITRRSARSSITKSAYELVSCRYPPVLMACCSGPTSRIAPF